MFICLLVGFSVFWVRRQNYEFFLITHIILSFWILVTMLGYAQQRQLVLHPRLTEQQACIDI